MSWEDDDQPTEVPVITAECIGGPCDGEVVLLAGEFVKREGGTYWRDCAYPTGVTIYRWCPA